MIRSPLISIVIVTRNELKDLKVAIASVQNQIYKNYELIVIDGNSTDGTSNFLSHSKNIFWISESDNGPYHAMNKAIKLAKGEYVYFLGSDDFFINSESLSHASNFLIDHINKKSFLNFKVILGESKIVYPLKIIDEVRILKGDKLCHQGIFFPLREMRKLLGFDERFFIASDQDLIIRAVINKIKVVNIDNIIACYGPGGLSSKGSLGETILILLKNKLYINAIKFMVNEYARNFLIKIHIIEFVRAVRKKWH